MGCNRVVFYVGPKGHKWLRFRWLFAFYDYSLMFFNITLGIAVLVARFVVWLAIGLLSIGRVDLCLLPSPSPTLAILDLGYTTYIALILQDHRYNNPVAACFYQVRHGARDAHGAPPRLACAPPLPIGRPSRFAHGPLLTRGGLLRRRSC